MARIHPKRSARRGEAQAHGSFPLRTVAAVTGLTPDLIRAWEKRYAVVAPARGPRGARLYTSADIVHLRLLARVVSAGRAIGDVAPLSRAELEKLAAQGAADGSSEEGLRDPSTRPTFVTRILERLERFDHVGVARLLGDAVLGLGIRRFAHEVALPLVHRVGSGWARGDLSIAEEHLLTGLLRNLLAGLMHSRSVAAGAIVLATPVGERHEIGLLLVGLLAADTGANVVYLGVDLPAAEIVTAATRSGARVLGLSLVASANRSRAIGEIVSIQSALPEKVELWLGGADAREVVANVEGFQGLVLDDMNAAEAELARIAGMPPHRKWRAQP
jgi:DNA-binding transcriptional MerR regulator/methylmalonyl-CoA mutase cobalamin-binding subunit